MTAYHDVRDALCKMTDEYGMGPQRILTDSAAFAIAPKIAAALRAERIVGYTTAVLDGGKFPNSDKLREVGEMNPTAGIEAMR